MRHAGHAVLASGVTVAISSGARNSGDQAYGLVEATAENRDHSPAILAWCSSNDSPAAARSAFSKIGYTWVGSISEWADSASLVPGRSMPSRSGGGTSAGWLVQSRAWPARPASMRLYTVSAPAISTTSNWPAPMAAAASFTSSCGLLPPTVDWMSWPGRTLVAPTLSANSAGALR